MSLHIPQLNACLEQIKTLPDVIRPQQNLPSVHCPRCDRTLLVYGRPGRYWAAHPLCGGACQDDTKTFPRATTPEDALTNAIDEIFPAQ